MTEILLKLIEAVTSQQVRLLEAEAGLAAIQKAVSALDPRFGAAIEHFLRDETEKIQSDVHSCQLDAEALRTSIYALALGSYRTGPVC